MTKRNDQAKMRLRGVATLLAPRWPRYCRLQPGRAQNQRRAPRDWGQNGWAPEWHFEKQFAEAYAVSRIQVSGIPECRTQVLRYEMQNCPGK